MKSAYLKSMLVVLVGVSLSWTVQAGKFYFPVGISYAQGNQDATDKLFDFYQKDGWTVDKISIPVGLTFNPYYELDFGLGFGVTVGPTAFIAVDEQNVYSSTTDTKFSYAIPVGGFVRYTLFREKTFAPYIRAGVRYPIAGGDNLGDSQAGAFGAIGLDLWRTKKVGMSLEIGYDDSRITVKYPSRGWSDKVTFSGFMAGISVQF